MLFRSAVTSIATLLAGLAMSITMAVSAQPMASTTQQTGVSEHHELQFRLMKDMSQVMTGMADEMSDAELTSLQKQQMTQRMQRMSTMMDRMAGLAARPAMKSPEMQKQMVQMRRQMDEMMRDMMTSAAVKPKTNK